MKSEIGDVITIPGKSGKWVVEDAKMTGGGYCHNDYYPDAWHVTARRLNEDGTYNPNGDSVGFTQDTNCYSNVIIGVEKVGKMKRIFV
jgi:hypothetical protein